MRRLLIKLPDPDIEPFEVSLHGLAEGGYAFEFDAMLTADEMLGLGTALKEWETRLMEEREVTAQEHAEACRMDVEVTDVD
jgi:hypothetical protein